jgi:hypothetical protein
MRSPEPISIFKDGGFNRPQVTYFYTLLLKLQSLDTAVYGPLKLCFEQAVCFFKQNRAGRRVNQYDAAKLSASAYLRVANPQNATSGFQSSGIWHCSPNVFSDTDYAPASVTDRPNSYKFYSSSSRCHPDPEIPVMRIKIFTLKN